MKAQRLAPELVTPRYEDSGLFRNDLCSLNVTLLPGPQRNARDDIIFDGLIDKTYRVPVFFAGRRAAMATLLENAADRFVAINGMGDDHDGHAVARRGNLTVTIDGAWRRLVGEDACGFARVTHQFIAAVWTLGTGSGRTFHFGVPPVR